MQLDTKITWKEFLSDYTNKFYFYTSVVVCFTLSVFTAKILALNAYHSGSIVYDPVMKFLSPSRNWSLEIFVLEYSAIVIMFLYAVRKPLLFINGIWGITTLFVVRTIVVKLIPLSPPSDIIYLTDPILQFFYGPHIEVKNDLFFSGHTSLLLLFFFIAQNKYIKCYLLLSAFIVATLLVWQHAHFIYDVAFAVIPCFLIYKWVVVQPLSRGVLNRVDTYFKSKKSHS
ncbi:MAG: hypothetical protein M9887_06600 [Chitinophagales bacterium]|nr:hypothetical protein [Chitinophagales bacterium]